MMFWSIFITRIAFIVIGKIPAYIKSNWLRKKGQLKELEQYAAHHAHNWAKSVMKMTKSTIKINGSENIPKDKTVLFVSNHQSNFDIPLLLSVIDTPIGFIAKSEMEHIPLFASWMKNLGCVFIDRKNMRKSAEAIVQGVNNLKSGHSMVIFPEGTRSKGGPPSKFKAGSFKMAIKANVDIVPITINGSYNCYEANNNKVKPANIELTFHPAVKTEGLSKEELSELHNNIESTIINSIK